VNKQNGWFARALVLGLLAVSALWFSQGCTAKAPAAPVFAIPPPVGLPNNVIDNFEDGNINMSVDLKGDASLPSTVTSYTVPTDATGLSTAHTVVVPPVPLGSWVASSWAGNTVNTPYVFTGASTANDGVILSTGALGTKGYCRLFGLINDPGNATYPAYQLEGKFNGLTPSHGANAYDASSFTGVQFYLNVSSDDTCPSRRFNIANIWTLPPSEGGNGFCTACEDHYGAMLPAGPTAGWVLKTYTFTSLSRQNFLAPATIPNNMPVSMFTDFVKLELQFGRNNATGSSQVNYAVDEFSFF